MTFTLQPATPYSHHMKARQTIDAEQELLDRALVESSRGGDIERVGALLSDGANVRAKDSYALRWSARNGHFEVVRLLLDRGADIHAENDEALCWASLNGHFEVVRLSLDRGADIHSQNNHALRWAIGSGHLEVVLLLLEYGADIEMGIAMAKNTGNSSMLDRLNRVKLSREEKKLLTTEVPVPERSADMVRM